MEKLCLCVFTFMYYQAGISSKSSCGMTMNVSGVEGGEVILPVDHIDVRDITWVTQKQNNVIAKTKPRNVIKDVTISYKGRLKATYNGSLVITNLTREDQGSYTANIMRSKQCTQEYDLIVYDKQYIITSNDTVCSHNSCSEVTGWHQHVLTKVVSAIIIMIIIVTAIVIFGCCPKLHPQCLCKSDNTPRKVSADDKEGSVWKINDIYNISSAGHRMEDSAL